MTNPVSRVTDERLAEMIAILDGNLPLVRHDTPDYAEISGPNMQAMSTAPDALMLLNDVPAVLTELQSLRALSSNSEGEAAAYMWRWLYDGGRTGPWHTCLEHRAASSLTKTDAGMEVIPLYTRPQPQHVEVSDDMVGRLSAWLCDDVLSAYGVEAHRTDPELADACRIGLTAALRSDQK